MTADQLAALIAESVPDGTFGGSRQPRRLRSVAKPEPKKPDPRAAEHRAALEAAIRRPRRAA